MKKIALSLFIIVSFFSLTAFTNNDILFNKSSYVYPVSGKVTECDGTTPISGATVKIVGYNIVTTTDVNGNYSIIAPSIGNSISFSSVGATTAVIIINKPKINAFLCDVTGEN